MNRFVSLIMLIGIAIQFSIFSAPTPAYPMFQNLVEDQRQEAIIYGKRGIRTEVSEFIEEWSVNKGLDGFAFITTEFLALAYAARTSALRMADLSNYDIEDTLAKSSGKLVFRVTLFGDSPDFAREYTAVILAGDQTIPTTFWSNPGGEPYGDGETSPTYVTDSDFFFPSEGIDPEGKITLVIQNESGEDVTRFAFDLGSLR
ncbi:MAG TPA: hypothetical protein VIU33_04940 [Nitrospiria bacterium]